MNLLHGDIATVHVVELDIVDIGLHIGNSEGVLSGEVDDFLYDHATNLQIERALGDVAIERDILKEMTQLT